MLIHLTGPDTYRSHLRMRQLQAAFRAKHDPSGLNISRFDGADVTAEQLRSALGVIGMFAAKRFIAIDRYPAKGAALSADELNTIVKTAAAGTDTIVVVREEAGAAPKRGAWPKRGKAPKKFGLDLPGAKVEIFEALTDGQLLGWVQAAAQERGGRIERAAANIMVTYIGHDMWRLSNELDKVLAYAGKEPVTVDQVEMFVPSPFRSDIFALVDAISRRQLPVAVKLLRQELAAGTHPLVLVSVLANHFRTLGRVKQAAAPRVQSSTIAARLGLHPFVVKKALEQSKQFDFDQLRRRHYRLLTIDRDLKSSDLDAETLLDLFVVAP